MKEVPVKIEMLLLLPSRAQIAERCPSSIQVRGVLGFKIIYNYSEIVTINTRESEAKFEFFFSNNNLITCFRRVWSQSGIVNVCSPSLPIYLNMRLQIWITPKTETKFSISNFTFRYTCWNICQEYAYFLWKVMRKGNEKNPQI